MSPFLFLFFLPLSRLLHRRFRFRSLRRSPRHPLANSECSSAAKESISRSSSKCLRTLKSNSGPENKTCQHIHATRRHFSAQNRLLFYRQLWNGRSIIVRDEKIDQGKNRRYQNPAHRSSQTSRGNVDAKLLNDIRRRGIVIRKKKNLLRAATTIIPAASSCS